MTKYEFYKDEIIDIVSDAHAFSVDKNGEIIKDCMVKCTKCIFNNDELGCKEGRIKWLLEEHVELPKLTKKERLLCELISEGYIVYAPALDVSFFVWSDKNVLFNPVQKLFYMEDEEGNITYTGYRVRRFNGVANVDVDEMFNFIKKSKRAWSIAELLELEVIEE